VQSINCVNLHKYKKEIKMQRILDLIIYLQWVANIGQFVFVCEQKFTKWSRLIRSTIFIMNTDFFFSLHYLCCFLADCFKFMASSANLIQQC